MVHHSWDIWDNFPLSGTRDATIVCRTNAHLILLYYKLKVRGIAAQLKGRKEVQAELLKLLDSAKIGCLTLPFCGDCSGQIRE